MTRLEVVYVSGARRLTVGELASEGPRIYFQYATAFLETGLELSPFHLPLAPGVIEERERTFSGLHGLFNDSLPDGWGLLLMDRALRSHGVDFRRLTPLDRLAFIGERGMGALIYRPPTPDDVGARLDVDLTKIAAQSARLLDGSSEDVLPELLRAGGSPGGARPKLVVGVSPDGTRMVTGTEQLPAGYRHFLIKFGGRTDPADMGALEAAYADMARSAGIAIPPVQLFGTRDGRLYFGVERFDRDGDTRHHVHTLAGLLHADHRIPGVDYENLLRATLALTTNFGDVHEAFRRMVFNVLAHNRDDHTKNFAFRMASDGSWSLAPAYDLAFADGPNGEHTMAVAGEGRAPTLAKALEVAGAIDIDERQARDDIVAVQTAVARWAELADARGVTRETAHAVQGALNRVHAEFGGGAGGAGRGARNRPAAR